MGGKKRHRSKDERLQSEEHAFGNGDAPPRSNFSVESFENAEGSSSYSCADEKEPDWVVIERLTKKRKKNKILDKDSNNYPAISHSPSARLNSQVKIGDLQALALYILADGSAPQWVAVRHYQSIHKVVVLMVPGFESGMFNGEIPQNPALNHIIKHTELAADRTEQSRLTSDSDASKQPETSSTSPDDYYPSALVREELPEHLRALADIFKYMWPVKTPGDDKYSKVYSPCQAMLVSPVPKSREEKRQKGPQPPREMKNWKNKRTRVTEFFATLEQMVEDEYPLHPALFASTDLRAENAAKRQLDKQTSEHGWVDTKVSVLEDGNVSESEIEQGSLTAGRKVLAMDCEMCKTEGDTFELTRVSLLSWDDEVILDELVKPERQIIDYLTQYSGITESMLRPVTTSLRDIQETLLEIITPQTVLVGHSLNSDLTALKLTHPFIVDTSIIYPHPRGPPLKSSLKWLAQKYLSREIQKNHGSSGHDSVEDARACLDLVREKCERGPKWGTSEANTESIFKRLERFRSPPEKSSNGDGGHKRGAVVDWGDPQRGYGRGAAVCVRCNSDESVVLGMKRAVDGNPEAGDPPVDFVWGRLRELEAERGWWSRPKTAVEGTGAHATSGDSGTENLAEESKDDVARTEGLTGTVARTVGHIADIYAGLPARTAFIVYSGTGDPREMARLQARQQQFRREYATKKWDELSVKWDDTEEQALRRACRRAREGIGFVTVK